ncbi:hypothetical protein BC941DRAFT_432828 [Chlamydoabsidia padenii]|nr:hypothetical protein BC941DRAFT_432828 [Chlamydoabsidia padenii]
MENDIVAIPRAQYQRWCRRLQNNQQDSSTAMGPSSSSCTESAASFRSVWRLPPELLLEILSYLADEQSTLYNVALVCRPWFLCATPILYKHAKIYNTYRWATFILTLGRDKRLFDYGSLAHTIDLSCGKDLEVMKAKDQETTQSSRLGTTTTTTTTILSSTIQPSHQSSTTTLTTASMNNVTVITATQSNNNQEQTELEQTNTTDAGTTENGITYELYDILSEDDCHLAFHTTPSLVVSTSSLIQLAQFCQNLVSIDLSYTHLFYDSIVAETGEYVSTLQNYAIQPGLTHVKIPIEAAITTIGQHCTQLEQVKMQCCGWVSARIIWLWVCACPKLICLDARRSSKCSVKRLTATVLQVEKGSQEDEEERQPSSLPPSSPPSASLSTASVSSLGSFDSDSTDSRKRWSAEENITSTSSSNFAETSHSAGNGESSRPRQSTSMEGIMDDIGSTAQVTFDDLSQQQRHHLQHQTQQHLQQQERQVHNRTSQRERQQRHPMIHTHRPLMNVLLDTDNEPMEEDGNHPWPHRHLYRRPLSPQMANNIPDRSHAHPDSPVSNQTLRDFVWSILKDGKEQGLMELQWLQD